MSSDEIQLFIYEVKKVTSQSFNLLSLNNFNTGTKDIVDSSNFVNHSLCEPAVIRSFSCSPPVNIQNRSLGRRSFKMLKSLFILSLNIIRTFPNQSVVQLRLLCFYKKWPRLSSGPD